MPQTIIKESNYFEMPFLKYIFFCILIILSNYQTILANRTTDSLVTILGQTDSINNYQAWGKQCLNIGHAFFDIPNYPKALRYYQFALGFSKRYEIDLLRKEAEVHIARVEYFLGRYTQSLNRLSRIVETISEDNLELKGLALRTIGGNHIFLGNYSEAYKRQVESLNIYTALKDSSLIAKLEYGLGTNFFYQEQHQVSLSHFKNAHEIYKKLNDTTGIFQSYGAFGSIYEQLDSFDKALEYNNLYYKLAESTEDVENMGWALLNISSNQEMLGKFEAAKATLKRGMEVSKKIGDTSLEGYLLETFANVYLKTHQYDKALNFLKQSFKIAQTNKDRSNILDIYKTFADIYFEKSDYKNYKTYIEKHISLKDSLLNEESLDKISGLQESFEIQKIEKENKIKLLIKNKELQKVRTYSTIGIAIAGTVILFLLLFLMYVRNKNQREKNELLTRKNKEILRQNESLAASNKDLENYAYIISHDLREPLRNISGFTTLLKRKFKRDNFQDKESEEYMDFIIGNTDQMNNLLIELLRYSKITMKDTFIQAVNCDQLLEDIILTEQAEFKNLNVTLNVSNLPTILFDKDQLYEVFAQLINNALKFRHVDRNPIITIESRSEATFNEITIEDNGIGIETTYFNKIFVVFKRLHHRGSYKGTGVGLAICKKIIEMRGGRIRVTSTLNEGTKVFLTIPKKLPNALNSSLGN